MEQWVATVISSAFRENLENRIRIVKQLSSDLATLLTVRKDLDGVNRVGVTPESEIDGGRRAETPGVSEGDRVSVKNPRVQPAERGGIDPLLCRQFAAQASRSHS